EAKTPVIIKGVDSNYKKISGVPQKLSSGIFSIGTADNPGLIVGYGVQNAANIVVDSVFAASTVTVILPKKYIKGNDPLASISEGNAKAKGVFAIQQEFDNNYALTNIDFVKQQMNFKADEFSAIEIKLKTGTKENEAKGKLQNILGNSFLVQTRYEQNTGLYNSMRLEKWAIFAVLTLILVIAAFNMISAITMLVLEKKKDISILRSLGSTRAFIQKIFLSEGILLGIIGAGIGIFLATVICLLQIKFHIIKLQGGSFLIDYFPVKLLAADFLLVAATALFIALIAAWYPSVKASKQPIALK
ncbi:MAG: ABC transporter permease, partial [Bacteroidetes bacterium]|nr:ABC transporter permease [Bacteroidota bacterium]